MVPCRFNLDLPLFGLGLSSQGHESNLWLSSNGWDGALFHWTLDLGHSSKVAIRFLANSNDKCNCHPLFLKLHNLHLFGGGG
jgi:hypothetical protein